MAVSRADGVITPEDQGLYLSQTIRMLGDILGEVIIEQAGRNVFHQEETIRLLAKNYRENNADWKISKDLTELITGLSQEERTAIIRSFSIFFQLVRVAEERYNIQANLSEKFDGEERIDTLLYAIQYAKSMGLRSSDLINQLEKIRFRLVFTAHPTEARRLTLLRKLRKIYELIGILDNDRLGKLLKDKIREDIKYQITLIWQSDELREEKIDVLDEVRSNLFYFETSLFDTVPLMYENLKRIINEEFKDEGERGQLDYNLPSFIEFGSWVGGDRDGHPGVTSSISYKTLLLQKRLCLRKYREAMEDLVEDLSASKNVIEVSKELEKSIQNDIDLFPEFAARTSKLNPNEPYRRKIDFIRLKLENTLEEIDSAAEKIGLGRTLVGTGESFQHGGYFYYRSNEFLEELRIIQNSLKKNKGKIIANGKLRTLINQVRIFGFHLAPLDIRQHAAKHKRAINELFNRVGLPELTTESSDSQTDILLRELWSQRPLGIYNFFSSDKFTKETTELFQSLVTVRDAIYEISPRSIGAYIISMCKSEADILIVALLMKEVGLLGVEDKVKFADVDIVPLFETKEDLLNAPRVMDNLFANKFYRQVLEARGELQEIMLGYSDSSKDVGYFESNRLILQVQMELQEVANKHKIRLKFFHGRGGSISRGGGSTNKSILSQPPGASAQVKITEQGEVIASKYSNPDLAYRNIEHTVNAIIMKNIQDKLLRPQKNPGTPPTEFQQVYDELGYTSSTQYNSLVKQNEGFLEFFNSATPLDLIERTIIGSRPSRRGGEREKTINDLRAIPWVFSWNQSRLIFSGFYGTGTALKVVKEKFGIEVLQKMYEDWPFFTSIIDNLQQVLTKVDLPLGLQYAKLCKNEKIREEISSLIIEEYKLSKELVLELTKNKELLGNYPIIRRSIIRRIPYIDPLSVIQLELLKEWRKTGRKEDLSADGLLRALLYTVNGIAAGLKNTG